MHRALRPRRVGHHRQPEAGSATVELAAAIPLLVAVTLAMVGVVGLARDQVLAQGAAREAAREAAMGGDRTRAVAAARAALPPTRASIVTVAAAGPDRVRASVQLPVRLPFGVKPVVVSATAVAALEPGPPAVPSGLPAATSGSPPAGVGPRGVPSGPPAVPSGP